MRFLCPQCRTVLTGEPGAELECSLCHQKATAPEHQTDPNAVIGDFAIVRELGRGGVGVIFLARQISLDRLVALKVLQKKFADDQEFVEGFIREARVAAKISHPNIVQAYAVGEEGGLYYFAMEYIDGSTMKQELKKEGKIAPKRAAETIASVADALDFAWTERKMVHQDIKPDNIMVTRRGQAKLADLGLARLATGDHHLDDDEDEVMGTPQYISPEQLTGAPTDVRSDIYSLGATFYHFVTGRFPYVGKDGNEIARQHVEGTFTPPKELNPDLPDELNRIITKMMEKNIEDRYQSAAELRDDLKNFLAGRKPGSAPKLRIPGAAPKVTAPPKVSAPPKMTAPKAAPPKVEAPKIAAPPKVEAPKVVAPPKVMPPAQPEKAPKTAEAPKVVPPVAPPIPAAPTQEPKKQEEPPAVTPPTPPAVPAQCAAVPPIPAMGSMATEEPEAAPEEPKKRRIFINKRKLIRLIIALVLVFVILGLLAGGLYAALRFDKVPEKYRDKLMTTLHLERKSDGSIVFVKPAAKPEAEQPKAKVEEKAKEVAAAPAKPLPKPKPVTRPEFLAGVEGLLNSLRNQMPEEEFLVQADNFYTLFANGPQTPEERASVARINEPFGRIDERLRVAPARRKLRDQQIAAAEARRTEAERLKQEEEARAAELRAQVEEQRRNAQRIAEEAAAHAKKQQAEAQKRFAEFQGVILADRQTLSVEFLRLIRTCDAAAWQKISKPVMDKIQGMFAADAKEKKAKDDFLALIKGLDNEMTECAKLHDVLASPDKIGKISIELSGNRLVDVVKLDGHVLYTTLNGGKSYIRLNMRDPRARHAFLRRLESRYKLQHCSYYLGLINGDYQFCTPQDAPNAFLKNAMPLLLTDYFKAEWQKADAAQKEALRKEFGHLAEFQKVAK